MAKSQFLPSCSSRHFRDRILKVLHPQQAGVGPETHHYYPVSYETGFRSAGWSGMDHARITSIYRESQTFC